MRPTPEQLRASAELVLAHASTIKEDDASDWLIAAAMVSRHYKDALAACQAENAKLKSDLDAAIDVMACNDISIPDHFKGLGRIAALEADIRAKDARIAELEAKQLKIVHVGEMKPMPYDLEGGDV